MVNSTYFVSPEVIQNRLSRRFKKIKDFHIDDIVEWCGDAETNWIGDIDLMFSLLQVPLTVTNGMALLPCNIFRINDCYTSGNRILDFSLNGSGAYLTSFKYHDSSSATFNETTVYLNYVGTPIDEDTGYPLIAKGHELVCETLCLIRSFEEDVARNRFNKELWAMWSQQISGQIINCLSNPFRLKTRQYLKDLETIRFNAIPRIGKVELAHEMFDDNGIIVTPQIIS